MRAAEARAGARLGSAQEPDTRGQKHLACTPRRLRDYAKAAARSRRADPGTFAPAVRSARPDRLRADWPGSALRSSLFETRPRPPELQPLGYPQLVSVTLARPIAYDAAAERR